MIDGGLGIEFKRRLEPCGFHIQRVETGGTGRGIPDSNYAAPGGVEGWLEFKVTTGWAVGLRPEQCGWLSRRARLGCRVFVAVRQQCVEGSRRARRDGLWLVPGGYAVELAAEGLKWAETACGTGGGVLHWPGPGPGRWDWLQIEKALI